MKSPYWIIITVKELMATI